jgi:hypothetical protein
MTAMSTPLAHYSVAGMETNVYALAVLVGLFAYARHLKAEARFTNWSVFLGLASWLRPEGFTLFGLLAVIDLARVWRVAGLRTASRATLGHLAWFGVIFGPLLMFRLAYFGELIPNTVTAKGGYAGELLRKPIEALLSEFPKHPGVTRLVEFYERSVAVLIPLALPALLLPALRAPTTACLAVLMAITAVHFWNAGDWMVHYRLLVPAIGPLAVMIASGLGALRTLVGNQRAGRVLYGISAIFIVAIGSWRQSYERGLGISALPRAPAIDAFGRTLAKIRREDDILATDLAGRVPYDSGLRTLDVFGLCDKKIAQLGTSAGRYGKHYWPRVAEVRPSLFYFQGAQEFKRMYEHPSFAPLRDDYLYVRTPFLKNMPQRVFLVRKDRPDVDLLEQTLRAELWTLERAGVTAR